MMDDFDGVDISNGNELLLQTNQESEEFGGSEKDVQQTNSIECDDLFQSLKFHIDSQQKLNQLNQSRIRSFERFRKYCQKLTHFRSGDENFAAINQPANNFDLEQFQTEYNKFDKRYRYFRKRIRNLRKQINSSSSLFTTRLTLNPYDTLYDLFVKIEKLNQSFTEDNFNNILGNNFSGCNTQHKSIQCDINDLIDNENHSSVCSGVKRRTRTVRGPYNTKKRLREQQQQKQSSLSSDPIYPEILIDVIEPNASNSVENNEDNNDVNDISDDYSPTDNSSDDSSYGRSKTKSKKKKLKLTRKQKTVKQTIPKKTRASALNKTAKVSFKKIKQEKTVVDSDSLAILPEKIKGKRGRKPKPPSELFCDSEGCQYTTTNSWTLKMHMRSHSDVRPFKCDKCEAAFKYKGDLNVHLAIHEGKRFDCTFEGCTRTYSTQRRMRKHYKIFHTKEAPLLHCDWEGCQYTTYNGEYLKVHRKLHTDERPFKCTDCELAFKSASTLWSHKLTHQTERRFKCTFEGCEYDTYNRELLLSHQFVHTTERQFKCVWPDCEQAFKTASGLWSHKMMHENQRRYKCTWEGCEYAANLWGILQAHVEAVHEKKKKPPRKRKKPSTQSIAESNDLMMKANLAIEAAAASGTMINCFGGSNVQISGVHNR